VTEAPEERGKLLGSEDRILRRLGDAELDDALGGDLDGFAGLGIAADACGAIFQHELADTGQGEGVLGVLVGKRGQMIQDFGRLLFRDFSFFGDGGDQLRFREGFGHS